MFHRELKLKKKIVNILLWKLQHFSKFFKRFSFILSDSRPIVPFTILSFLSHCAVPPGALQGNAIRLLTINSYAKHIGKYYTVNTTISLRIIVHNKLVRLRILKRV